MHILGVLQKAANLSLKEKHYEVSVYAYGTMADCYMGLRNQKEWEKHLRMANELAKKIDNNQFIAMGYSNLLQGLTHQKKYSEALQCGQKALEILKDHPYPALQMEVDSAMYVANKASGNYAKAIEFYESYVLQKSILLNEIQKLQMSEIQTRFEVQKKDLLIKQQKLKLTREQRSIQLLIFILTLFSIVIIGSVVYVVRNHRFRKELYKKEKYLDKQLADTKQWMEGVFIKESFIPTVFKQLPFEGEASPINRDILSPQNILYSELREIIEMQKLYLNPELNLQMVIKLLGTNKKYLYEAISSNTDNNFRNIINRYRIDQSKKLIEESIRDKTTSNLSELSSLCGFNNTTSFFRTFKAITGLTPKEYASEVENDVREEKLASSI